MKSTLDRLFKLEARGTTVATELRAGLTTFLTLAYILFVNPQILSQAGMPATDVAVATAVAGAVATLVMGLYANFPFALAPGMGLNAYFTFGVVRGLGVSWQIALAAVFVEGILFVILSVTGLRSHLLRILPQPIKVATMAGIGLLLAMIGLQNAGIMVSHPDTIVALGDLRTAGPLLALAGILVSAALMAIRFRGALLVGILSVTAASWALGLSPHPTTLFSLPHLPSETFLAFDFSDFGSGALVVAVIAFLFVDIFDTAGSLIGVGQLGGFVDEDRQMPGAGRAFTSDAVGTVVGAALGTSTVTTFVESATGVEEGGRTGLTAVVVGICLLLALFVTPILTVVPVFATAPALIVVGALMMRGARELDWANPLTALPAFLTVVLMPATYSIATGISLGLVSSVVLHVLTGRWRKVHPALYVLTLLLALFYLYR
jgi:AGZA family xanthine/uracil permease-like MFS transporter